MNNCPQISIIISIYNAELYLSKMLSSISAQTYDNYEVILINDGSTDNSGEICNHYQSFDKRVKVIHKTNSGVSSSRNIGIENAIGNYLIFFDSDDWVDNTTLEKYIDAIDVHNPDIVFQGIVMVYSGKEDSLYLNTGYYKGKSVLDAVIYLDENNLLGWMCNKIFRRDIINKYNLRFNEKLFIQEDYVFIVNYLCCVDSLLIDSSCCYYYRRHDASLSNKRNSYYILQNKNIILYNNLKILFQSNTCFPEEKFIHDSFYSFVRMYEDGIYVQHKNRINEYRLFLKFINNFERIDMTLSYKVLLFILNIMPTFLLDFLIYVVYSSRLIFKYIKKIIILNNENSDNK